MSMYAVVNPATGDTVSTYPLHSDDDLGAALASANAAHRGWSASTTPDERAALVRRVGELHTERREELAAIIVREMGKALPEALGEVDFCADIYAYYADHGAGFLADEPLALSSGSGSAVVRKSSLG